MDKQIKTCFTSLRRYCENEKFKGWDPFDGLNSRIFQATPLKNSRIFRLVWLQLFKRSPFNLRPLFRVPKEYNPKALGLFLSGYCFLYQSEKQSREEIINSINFLSNKILQMRSPNYKNYCWGYNFDWQARAFFQPKWTPTVVATTFVAYSLLDAYQITKDDRLLKAARSAGDFVLKDLNRTYDTDGNFAFSYSPLDKTQVFNASFLGTRLLSRLYSFTQEKFLIEEAKKAVRFCCKYQSKDGSWPYSPKPYHSWIDSFHTGYNLECLSEYQKYSGDDSYKENLEKGIEYYLTNFFLENGTPKYYSNKNFPIDIHSPSQLIVTLVRNDQLLANNQLVDKVLNWSIQNMFNWKKSHFFYQKVKYYTNKISYIRWVQADMFYSLAMYINQTDTN